jgi:hypothetical protein
MARTPGETCQNAKPNDSKMGFLINGVKLILFEQSLCGISRIGMQSLQLGGTIRSHINLNSTEMCIPHLFGPALF